MQPGSGGPLASVQQQESAARGGRETGALDARLRLRYLTQEAALLCLQTPESRHSNKHPWVPREAPSRDVPAGDKILDTVLSRRVRRWVSGAGQDQAAIRTA